jgi:hypothetical protein
MLEEGYTNTSDYFYMLVLVCMSLFLFSNIFYIPILGPCLSSVITYVWTRKNPTTHVQLLGCVIFPAFYLPFIVPIFTLISERKIPRDDLLGIIVGHLYYFFKFVYPTFGKDVLETPRIVKKMFCEDDGIDEDEAVEDGSAGGDCEDAGVLDKQEGVDGVDDLENASGKIEEGSFSMKESDEFPTKPVENLKEEKDEAADEYGWTELAGEEKSSSVDEDHVSSTKIRQGGSDENSTS